ncbi:MAG: tRNA glutamyl-Q(34) synthetase GluQRS [Alphaproteobacteria bacterium]|nr:tRNA glutamyl-Q(34) synthetase GluQRS [Alphaproteobacteria bacterium]
MGPVLRFAPSPNGYLHAGHAYSAILNFDRARSQGGRFVLRIEDIDMSRCRPHFETAIYEDLAWLGIAWETPVRLQSEHLDEYRAVVDRLLAQGLLYPAFESRAEVAAAIAEQEAQGKAWPRDPDGAPLYPGSARTLAPAARERLIESGVPYALRLDMAAACRRLEAAGRWPLTWSEYGEGTEAVAVVAAPLAWGDVILARKETPTSYHLSVVVDDALQGISDVLRGQDLFHATAVQRLLQELLDLPEPVYRHHRLIPDPAGRKLAKSAGSTSLRQLREDGVAPGDVRRLLGLG